MLTRSGPGGGTWELCQFVSMLVCQYVSMLICPSFQYNSISVCKYGIDGKKMEELVGLNKSLKTVWNQC